MSATNFKSNFGYLRSDNEIQSWGNAITQSAALHSTRIKQPFMEQLLTRTGTNTIGNKAPPDWRGPPCAPQLGTIESIPFGDSQLRQDAVMGNKAYIDYHYRNCSNQKNSLRDWWNKY